MHKLITSTKILQDQILEILADSPTYVSVDTEFVRQSSYYPKVGLIQIGHNKGTLVIDALACDLDVLKPLFFNAAIIKVFHSARQDLEIFYKVYGEVPYPLSDLQISAGFLGFGQQVSLESLAEYYLHIQLKKIHRYGDWLKRPLQQSLIDYAYDDAVTIYHLYPIVQNQLNDMGRLEWVQDLLQDLKKWPITLESLENVLKKCRHDLVDDHHIKLFYTLALWREEQAKFFDKPRAHIINDHAMCVLIKSCPLVKPDYKSILAHHAPKSHALRHQDVRKNLFLYLSDIFEGKISVDIDLDFLKNKQRVDKSLKERVKQVADNLDIPINFFLSQTELLALSHNNEELHLLPQWKKDALNNLL
ncbi:MAG: hypothetical protein COY39_05645 [Alphaproteobacteria bacterium CG_4_10_14_0_8_um_filter_37_21]|nr:MAG: hypothetical protein COY39_05645 [Alphaproteobacteria bacterium CG_4_10_14_0_8_um_filter_37_21]